MEQVLIGGTKTQVVSESCHFRGNFDLTIDSKARLTVPSRVRDRIKPDVDGRYLILTIGKNGNLWIYTEKTFNALAAKQLDRSAGESVDDDVFFGSTQELEMDNANRLPISERTMKKFGLGNDVTLLGAGDHLEVLSQADWSRREADEIVARQARARQKLNIATSAVSPMPSSETNNSSAIGPA